MVSRAPIGTIEALPAAYGPAVPAPSPGSDFNYDFHVTHDEDVAPIEYGFKTKEELIEAGQEWSIRPAKKGGLSVFLRDGNTVLHTYSDYGAILGLTCGTDNDPASDAVRPPRMPPCGTTTGTARARIAKYKIAKHFELDGLTVTRKQTQIEHPEAITDITTVFPGQRAYVPM